MQDRQRAVAHRPGAEGDQVVLDFRRQEIVFQRDIFHERGPQIVVTAKRADALCAGIRFLEATDNTGERRQFGFTGRKCNLACLLIARGTVLNGGLLKSKNEVAGTPRRPPFGLAGLKGS